MGMSLAPVYFFDVSIEIGEIESASKAEFFKWDRRHMTLGQLGPGRLEKYDDRPGHYLYTFLDGEWVDFHEAVK